jgi:hypothetical protein
MSSGWPLGFFQYCLLMMQHVLERAKSELTNNLCKPRTKKNSNWFRANKMAVNTAKTKLIVFQNYEPCGLPSWKQ